MDKNPQYPLHTHTHINFKQHSYVLFTDNTIWRKPHPSSQINKQQNKHQNSSNYPHGKPFKQQVGARTDREAVSLQTN